MATVTIYRHKVSRFSAGGGVMPVANAEILAQQTITTSGVSQTFTGLTSSDAYECWTVVVKGGDVIVKFGVTPTAAVGDGWLLSEGTVKPFAVNTGWTAAVING